jgi:hypothetical protein
MKQKRAPLPLSNNVSRDTFLRDRLPPGRQEFETGDEVQRRDDNDEGYISESTQSDGRYLEVNKENVPPGRGRQLLSPPDSRSPTPTPAPTPIHNRNLFPQYKTKKSICIRNPRDGIPFLRLEPGTLVQVYFDSKHDSKS